MEYVEDIHKFYKFVEVHFSPPQLEVYFNSADFIVPCGILLVHILKIHLGRGGISVFKFNRLCNQ